jgi:hypothetical protein
MHARKLKRISKSINKLERRIAILRYEYEQEVAMLNEIERHLQEPVHLAIEDKRETD